MKKLFCVIATVKISFFLIMFAFSNISFSQNPDIKRTNHWYFGNKAGLDFSSGVAKADTNGQMEVVEGCVSISDTNGNLLFYSDGISVWSKNHQPMPNGTGLLAETDADMALTVPLPENTNIYYFFYIGYDTANFGINHLYYSIIDMSLQGGLGDVIQKNNIALTMTSYKVAAIKNANNKDIWIITMGTSLTANANKFFVYKLTSTGLDTNAIISSFNPVNVDANYTDGYLKPSPDGKKLAAGCVHQKGPAIFDFDNNTGIVSNAIVAFPPCPSPSIGGCETYGVEFSPDGTKLYFTVHYADTLPKGHSAIYQVEITGGDSASIINSKILIDTISVNDTITFDALTGTSAAIQLGADKKIYLTKEAKSYMGIINAPDLSGMACNVVDSAVYLGSSQRYNVFGLPSFMNSYLPFDTLTSVLEYNKTEDENPLIYPNPFTYTTNIITASSLNIMEIEMLDLLGRKTENKKKITKEIDKATITIERNNLPAGIYFLNIKTNNSIYSQKLIITD